MQTEVFPAYVSNGPARLFHSFPSFRKTTYENDLPPPIASALQRNGQAAAH